VEKVSKSGTRLLRSHCDWTLSTPIPVSAIPGLEVFDSSSKQWVRIEQVLANMHDKQVRADQSSRNWNSEYVIVLTGLWLELLTKGSVEAAVHRVVSDATCQTQRLSAPLFLRPRESLFRQVDNEFNQVGEEKLDHQQSVTRIGDYLAQQ
jgi:isopenicillin N synthase-like dioxygenase